MRKKYLVWMDSPVLAGFDILLIHAGYLAAFILRFSHHSAPTPANWDA